MSLNKNLKGQRSGDLDVLRFLAVFIVFFAHYADTFNMVYNIVPENLKWLPVSKYSIISLLMFFMVSGYVITLTSIKRSLPDFLVTRLSRLYPLFWVSCIVAFALPRLIHEHIYLTYSHVKMLVANMTMMPQAFGYDMINPVYWTLLVELGFYFCIAMIILFKLWDKIVYILGIAIVSCLIATFKNVIGANLIFPSLMAGMLMYLIKVKYKDTRILHVLLIADYVAIIAGFRLTAKGLDAFYKTTDALNVYVMSAAVTVVFVLFYVVTVVKPLIKASRLTTVLGEISYPVYLFHIYFMWVYWYFRKTIQHDILLLFILALVLASSWLINVAVEKPLSKLTTDILNFVKNLFTKKDKAVYVPENNAAV